MITAFQSLHHWFAENDINSANVSITLVADPAVADRIGHALRRESEKLSMLSDKGFVPIRDGHICGIKFNVVDR